MPKRYFIEFIRDLQMCGSHKNPMSCVKRVLKQYILKYHPDRNQQTDENFVAFLVQLLKQSEKHDIINTTFVTKRFLHLDGCLSRLYLHQHHALGTLLLPGLTINIRFPLLYAYVNNIEVVAKDIHKVYLLRYTIYWNQNCLVLQPNSKGDYNDS